MSRWDISLLAWFKTKLYGRGTERRSASGGADRAAAGGADPEGAGLRGLLAFIATAKFCDALPLYRQERQFARLGVELSRRTMSDWMIAAATACQALMEALRDKLRCGPILAIDETTVQVLKEQERANTDTSYVWVARGGPPDEPVVVYRYEPSRAARVAAEIIGDYQGYVQTDGYDGYARPCAQPGIVHVGCWAVDRPLGSRLDDQHQCGDASHTEAGTMRRRDRLQRVRAGTPAANSPSGGRVIPGEPAKCRSLSGDSATTT